MTVINGMPAHALLLHFVVVLVPLTALLEIVCVLWPTARRGPLLWLAVISAAATMVLTPITVNAGEWLYDLRAKPSAILQKHATLGGTMNYFAAALLAAALVLVVMRVIERRSDKSRVAVRATIAIVVLAIAVASTVQIYRVGDAGAQSVWGDEIAHLKKAHPG
ncbi:MULTISPECIES: DUF2231 domain-containing protein [unclassified Mycobacterium]|uniref:DUF2231 domain-containing protein n=1 Tax=unclassified Mycobacterium TaxID=2642494 RepID=UPI0006DCB901|nr:MULTISPECIES: DUF2231 domain-containing protein [unclassified Mycobacterium]OBF11433.1 hypothetical protein A5730_05835 [Mycobacterium sp. ACS4054]OBG59892.1 hypothetical protein A5702_05685 [Mycobacterium sp. E3339]